MNEPRMSGAVSPDEFRRLRDIFESALERPPAERSRYVEGACAGDSTLIGEVERMLRADAEPHRILDASVLLPVEQPETHNLPPTALEPGRRVGPYEIICFSSCVPMRDALQRWRSGGGSGGNTGRARLARRP